MVNISMDCSLNKAASNTTRQNNTGETYLDRGRAVRKHVIQLRPWLYDTGNKSGQSIDFT